MPWTYEATLDYYGKIKGKIVEQGGKIYQLTPEEKSAQLKDSFALYPRVKDVRGETGTRFIELLEPYRDK